MSCDHAELMSLETEDIESHELGHELITTSAWGIKKRWKMAAGVFAAVAFGGIASRGNWTNRVASTSSLGASIELADSDEDKWKSITCPVLGALFKEGDLTTDADGFVTAGACFAGMVKAGISESAAHTTTRGNFAHLDRGEKINLFHMDVHDDSFLSKNIEHDKSTGIRDGTEPDEDKYDEFEQFISTDGNDESWSLDDIKAAIKHYQRNTNDEGTAEGGLNSIKVMFNQFMDDDKKLSKAEMKGLFLNSDYPKQFKQKRDEALSD